MPTEKQIQNLVPFEKGKSGNPLGRPVGVKNRTTIAKHWLEAQQSAKNPITNEVQTLTQEDIMTLAQIKKAREGDVAAYKALMDSAYGAPAQFIESDNKHELKQFQIEIIGRKEENTDQHSISPSNE